VNDAFLSAGWYLYAGNAGGPGGLRARVSRHLRTEKKPRWHVDQLTIAAETSALVFAEKNECGLIADLLASSQFTTPLPGFGSSDCRACESHLLAIK
ncbi:MAG: GIY-YIG nuclease family protein, partial [Hyphomicrobiales bacterium]